MCTFGEGFANTISLNNHPCHAGPKLSYKSRGETTWMGESGWADNSLSILMCRSFWRLPSKRKYFTFCFTHCSQIGEWIMHFLISHRFEFGAQKIAQFSISLITQFSATRGKFLLHSSCWGNSICLIGASSRGGKAAKRRCTFSKIAQFYFEKSSIFREKRTVSKTKKAQLKSFFVAQSKALIRLS